LINQDFPGEVIGKPYFNFYIMKRLPEIVTFCCIIVGFLTSGTIEKKSDDARYSYFLSQTEHDTTGLVGFLKVDSFNLSIIPPSSGVRFFRDGLVFLSNSKYEGKMLPKHVSFGSIEAYSAMVKDTSLGLHMLFFRSSSFSYPCEAITFSSDFKTMYFTKIAKKEKREKIYRAEFKYDDNNESDWVTDINPVDFCTGNYIYTHPALSADGKTMIFCSDMNGSSGGMDLFIVRKDGDKWSKPENLGKSINTSGDECFPFIDSDNNLFFSSDGLKGYGGYDIFTCKFNGESWDKPMNLSRKINSENDDIAFSIDKKEGKSAFFTARQKSFKSEMQLFKVSLTKELVDNNPLTISYVYNGRAVPTSGLLAMKPVEQTKPVEKEPAKTVPGGVKKDETKVDEKKAPAEAETKAKTTGAKVVIIKPTSSLPEKFKDVVVYRIQFLSTTKQRKESQVIINGVSYQTYEYFYLDAYRYTIGEFLTLTPAKELQNICRKSGFPQAFVAAFKNNTRSLDLILFK
jgi:hypothetical protein